MIWATVNFGKNDNNMNSKTDTEVEMVMRHVRWRMTTIHQNERIVSHTRCYTMDSTTKET